MISSESLLHTAALANKGDFLSAIEVLGEAWPGLGQVPVRCSDDDLEHAHLLLACGVISVEMGRFHAVPCQAAAKDLLSTSIRLFGSDPAAHEALLWLALAYLWCGENAETLAITDSILNAQTADSDLVFGAARVKGLACLNLGKFSQAEDVFASVEVFLDTVSPMSRGKFHLNRGMLYRQTDRLDKAVAEYDLASVSFRDAGSLRYQAAVQNNLAGIYSEQGRFAEAHAAAQSALVLFESLRDLFHEAKVWDQIAQIFGREQNYVEMERCAFLAVEILSSGDHQGWLAEALITLGSARARLGMEQAQEALSQALSICDQQGDPQQAHAVTMAMWEIVQRSDRLNDEIRFSTLPVERSVYERVLADCGGHVTPAAHMLGYTHQAFFRRLGSHFPDLLNNRGPAQKKRCRSLMNVPRNKP